MSDPAEDGRDVDLELAADPTTDPPAESESPINIETNTSDVMSLDEDSDVSGQDGAGVQTEDDKTAPDGLDGHQRTADTPEGIIIVDSDEDSAMDDNILPSSPSGASRYLPIQVVLTPPSDPSSYEKVVLPTSWFVSRVLEEIQAGGELWYSVEFDDGRVDQVSVHARTFPLILYTPYLLFCAENPSSFLPNFCFWSCLRSFLWVYLAFGTFGHFSSGVGADWNSPSSLLLVFAVDQEQQLRLPFPPSQLSILSSTHAQQTHT